MKKILMLFVMAATMLSLTSCDDDKIAQTLDGVWEGQVSTARWNSYQYVDIQFSREGYSDGYGVEYDYFSSGGYVECPFTYKVTNGRIFMEYEDGSRIAISNYTLTETQFSGEFCEWIGSYSVGNVIARFDFVKVTSWRHNRYSNYYYYIGKSDSTATSEKEATPIKEKADNAE